jgi:cytochrome c-type biogenesis protein CcmH/NrfG
MRIVFTALAMAGLMLPELMVGAEGLPADLEQRGKTCFTQAEFKCATDALEKAAAADPGSSTVQMWLGRAWGRRAELASPLSAFGYAKKARLAFENAVRLDPRNVEAASDLFDFYIEAPGMVGGGLEKARALIPAIAVADPSQGLFAQARIDEASHQYDSAEARLRRAIELAPRELGRVLDLARYLSRAGRYSESEISFTQAETLAPGSPRILFARAETYIATKRNTAEARDLLHRYLAANLTTEDPPASEARKLLRKVEGA